jgi:hypothetical protein
MASSHLALMVAHAMRVTLATHHHHHHHSAGLNAPRDGLGNGASDEYVGSIAILGYVESQLQGGAAAREVN